MKGKRKLMITEDGSHTVYDPHTGEYYHSIHGAITESRHVFINAGFHHARKFFDALTVFEVGFGTGLNALLTYTEAEKAKIPVTYHAIEPYPLDETLRKQLNYAEFIQGNGMKQALDRMHQQPGTVRDISPLFQLHLLPNTLESFLPQDEGYNLIYFDAFSPQTSADLWHEGIFQKMHAAMQPDGVLVTYSAKGSVRRGLQQAGFRVERLPGPVGKREMLRAVKISNSQFPINTQLPKHLEIFKENLTSLTELSPSEFRSTGSSTCFVWQPPFIPAFGAITMLPKWRHFMPEHSPVRG